MTFGVILTITNPIHTGYLSFKAALNAWNKIADEIVVIDGGSTDGSIEYIRQTYKNNEKIVIISNEVTSWGEGDLWNLMQATVNHNYAFQHVKSDWVHASSTDYIPYNWNRQLLEEELKKYEKEIWVRTHVGKPLKGRIVHNYNNRNIVFNMRKIKAEKINVTIGIDKTTGISSDFPIIAEEQAYIKDPVKGIMKAIYKGRPIISNQIMNLECIAYGHFFYTRKQLEYKITRWDRANSRFYGKATSRLAHLLKWHKVPDGDVYYTKDEIIRWDHPLEIIELINSEYKKGMIGGTKIKKPQYGNIHELIIYLYRIEKKLREVSLKVFNKIEGENDKLIWTKINKCIY